MHPSGFEVCFPGNPGIWRPRGIAQNVVRGPQWFVEWEINQLGWLRNPEATTWDGAKTP